MNAKRATERSIHPKQAVRRTSRNRVAALSDAQIERAVRSDPDAAPIADPDWSDPHKRCLADVRQGPAVGWFLAEAPLRAIEAG
jgi:hypothetical protein